MFDKKRFENYLLNYGIIKSKNSSQDKIVIQAAYEVLRNQVSNLAKLKHPNILALVEPLEEHSKNFMFVTEYVTGSLDSVFGNGDEETNFFKGHVREDIVIQRGILEVTQALEFIHNRASFVHLDIQPRSIFINENSDWKVSGLGHLIKLPQGTNTSEYYLPQYDPRVPSFIHLELDYTAPEIILDNTLSFKNDYFSLGLLVYMLYTGKSLFHTENSTSQYRDEYAKFERRLATMSWESIFSKLPENLRHCMPKLMNRDLFSRYDNISEFLESQFFQDPLIKTLNFLDDLPTKSNEEKLLFLKGLVELLPQFPVTLLQRKFLTVLLDLLDILCKDKVSDSSCISMDVLLIIKIGSTLSQLTFQERIFPVLTNKINFPILLHNATLSLIDNLSTLKEKLKKDDFLEVIAKPLLTYTFNDMENDSAIIAQEKLLENLFLVSELFEFLTIKNFLVPLISNLFTKTTSLTIKIASVSCFQLLIERKSLDTDIICDDILPLFRSMKTRDHRILMQSLKLFEIVPLIVKKDMVLVEQLLPLMWNYSMAPNLQTAQYTHYTNAINKLSSDIQRIHIKTLQKSSSDASSEGPKDFSKLIEPIAVKREDPDTKAAKKIAVPAIQPIKKSNSLASRPTPKQSTPLVLTKGITSTTKSQSQSRGFPRRTLKEPTPSSRIATKPTQEGNLDDFDDFVSASASPVSQVAPKLSNGNLKLHSPGSTTYGSTIKNSAPSATSNASLPPGFSVSLQPSRKSIGNPSSNPTSTTNLNNSLI